MSSANWGCPPSPALSAPLSTVPVLPVAAGPPAPVLAPASVNGSLPTTVPQLLKDFAKRPECGHCKTDTEKILLLTEYLWLRQLTPSLPFETFLDLYAKVADHDDSNLKHPAAALTMLCPRSKPVAERLSRPQWSAHQVADFTSLYVEMVRAAEAARVPVPLDFRGFLEKLGSQYLAGGFAAQAEPVTPQALFDDPGATQTPGAQPAPPAQQPKKSRKAAAKKETPVVAITDGQRVVFTHPSQRQFAGVAVEVIEDNGHKYVNFQSDAGERFDGVAIACFRPVLESDGPFPASPAGPELGRETLWIPRAQYIPVANVLSLAGSAQPVGTIPVGQSIYQWAVSFGVVAVVIDVMNGDAGPYVDARLVDAAGTVLSEVPPRQQLLGTYSIGAPDGVYVVEVKTRGEA